MNDKYVDILLKEADKAFKTNNVPVGALIIKEDKIISKAYNKKETTNIVTDHAEIIAINKACKKLKTWRLNDCILYTTLKPCKMCMATISEARIKKVIYLLDSNYYKNNNLNIKMEKIDNDLKYQNLINLFFKNIR